MNELQASIINKMNEILSSSPCPTHNEVPKAVLEESKINITACCEEHVKNSALLVGAKPPEN